jgi:hypothetical protein
MYCGNRKIIHGLPPFEQDLQHGCRCTNTVASHQSVMTVANILLHLPSLQLQLFCRIIVQHDYSCNSFAESWSNTVTITTFVALVCSIVTVGARLLHGIATSAAR